MNKTLNKLLPFFILQILFLVSLSAQDITSEITHVCDINNDGGVIVLTVTIDDDTPPPYNFIWVDEGNNIILDETNSDGISELNNLSPGEYCVEVTYDGGYGCEAEGCFIIEDNVDPEFEIGLESIDCICSNGSIGITITGSSEPYTYSWTGPNGFASDIKDPNDLVDAGEYSVIVSNSLGCSIDGGPWLVGQCDFDFNNFETTINQSCNGLNSGSIEVTVSPANAATSPFSFTLKDINNNIIEVGESPDGNILIDGLGEGEYCLDVLSANGCTSSGCGLIINGFEPPSVTWVITPPTNLNSGDGLINLEVQGNSGPFSYLWETGETSEDISGLYPGIYTVEITYGEGNCTQLFDIEVKHCDFLSTNLQVSSVVTPMTVLQHDGAIDLTIENVNEYEFIYLWSNGETTEDIDDLAAGTYSVTISHSVCSEVNIVLNFKICDFGLDLAFSEYESCTETTVSAIVNSGTPPFSYNWTNTDTQFKTSIPYGEEHCVTVTDGIGCQAIRCITIVPPELELDLNVTNATWGLANGNVSTNVQGGFEPYTYLWDNGSTSYKINYLIPGDYCVTVTDACGNSISDCETVECEIGRRDVSVDITDVSCNGGTLGAIDLEVLFYDPSNSSTYTWSNGATTEDISGLYAGEYCVTIENGWTNCVYMNCFTVGANGTGEFSLTFDYESPCFGVAENGAITVNTSGGESPFTYYWTNYWLDPPLIETTQTISNITGGFYGVVVTDVKGCSVSDLAFLWAFPTFDVEVDISPEGVLCPGETASATAIISGGGTPPYTYTWKGNCYPCEDLEEYGSSISELNGGLYFVTVVDAEGCQQEKHFYIKESTLINIDAYIQPMCFISGTVSPGEIQVTHSGGTFPYSYEWSNGSLTQSLQDINEVGEYTLTITDAIGCTIEETYTMYQEMAPNISSSNITSPICLEASDGYIEINHLYGSQFTYQWSNGATTKNIYDLAPGNYIVTITSEHCGEEDYAFEIERSPLFSFISYGSYGSPSTNPPGYIDTETGSIDITVQTEWGPHTFQWSNGETTEDIDDLASGPYTVTVTDAYGCTNSLSIYVQICLEYDVGIAIYFTDVVPSVNGNDGSISPTINGNPPYIFNWTGPNGFTASTQNISNLEPGMYYLTVTDACYNTATISKFITYQCTLDQVFLSKEEACDDSPIHIHTIWGSPGAYYYEWSTGASGYLDKDSGGDIQILSGQGQIEGNDLIDNTNYCVTITNEYGCTASDCILYNSDPYPYVVFDLGYMGDLVESYNGPYNVVQHECSVDEYCGSEVHEYGQITSQLLYIPVSEDYPCIGGSILCPAGSTLFEIPDGTWGEPVTNTPNCGCIFPPGTLDQNPEYPIYVEYDCSFTNDPEPSPCPCLLGYLCVEDECHWVEDICTFYEEVEGGSGINEYEFYHELTPGTTIHFSYNTLTIKDKIHIYGSGIDDPIECVATGGWIQEDYVINGGNLITVVVIPCANGSRYHLDIGCTPGFQNNPPSSYIQSAFDSIDDQFTIYPNPFKNLLMLELDSNQEGVIKIELFDIFGNIVLINEKQVLTGSNKIPIQINQSLPDGVYQVSVSDNYGNKFIRKVVHFKG